METVKDILRHLTLREKVKLLVGKDFWHTNSVKRLGLPSLVVSDGPFGLRKVENQGMNALEQSLPATAFPTTSLLASTFNDELLEEIGVALAKECIDQGVDIILGPGLNIKRHPLCGRNFEYFSEDPYLSGRLSTSLVAAIEGQGIGTSVKHFAVNNQEDKRLLMNAIVDERALFEIYLRGFEMVIKNARPTSVMCSYNQVNGLHASRNPFLLKEVLRQRFGYQGLIVSDWGAVVDLGASVKAGLNLEMPGGHFSSKKLVEELLSAGVKEKEIDQAISPLIELMLRKKARVKSQSNISYGDHHNLAVKAATEGAVLLKNEQQLLPLKKQASVALIGEFAKKPRYQGSGSSRINPRLLESAFEAFTSHQVNFSYTDGYQISDKVADDNKFSHALELAKNNDYVVVMVGLPDEYEMEGMDRTHLDLPLVQNQLIEQLTAVSNNIIVILSAGSPVLMPWLDKVKAVLHMHLAGQGSGEALYQLLFGEVVPSGKLAETYPLSLDDVPSNKHFGRQRLNVEYRESIYVGYRYYTKADKKVLFPFGYGLSYSSFIYKDIELSANSFDDGDEIVVKATIKNSGKYDAKEIVQLYVGPRKQKIFAAPIELKNYQKVLIKAGEEKVVEFKLKKDDFALYDIESKTFKVDDGTYKVYVAPHSGDLKLSRMIKITTDFAFKDLSEDLPSYYQLNSESLDVPFSEFSTLYGKRINHYYAPSKRPFSANNCLNDTRTTFMGRFIAKKVSAVIKDMAKGNELNEQLMLKVFLDTPIRSYSSFSGGAISKRQIHGIVSLLNLRIIQGIFRLIPSRQQRKAMKKSKK